MTALNKPRVMWLLNHGSARKFEVPMLKQIGIEEIFLPKKLPDDITFRSASIDYSEDINLTIPADELAVLNEQNWYEEPSREAWEIANHYFDILFFIVQDMNIFKSLTKNFKGTVLWRVYGRDRALSYSGVLQYISGNLGKLLVKSLGERFFFTEAYDHLHLIEDDFLRKRALFLPLGMHDCFLDDKWRGSDKRVFFVCPALGYVPYYEEIYKQFIEDFKGLKYAVGGEQLIAMTDPNILGFVPKEEHERNMREMRVMFYHSTEPNHIHYHPFEAIKVGMPLVFMGGGLLDRMGGKNLPGRCKNIKEARRKIERILNDDWALIKDIRKSQGCLLDPMKSENCVEAWHKGFELIFNSVKKEKKVQRRTIKNSKRIAIVLPIEYKGGSLRGAKLLAQAIDIGARRAEENVEVVFCHLEGHYTEEDFRDLPTSIKQRPYTWLKLNKEEANRALIYAGLEQTLKFDKYLIIDDKINQLMDCDLLVIVSDRLSIPLLPIKPYVVMVYDYLQRHVNIHLSEGMNQQFINVAHSAERVIVTTEFTRNDALQFVGLSSQKVIKVPMLAPQFSSSQIIAKQTPQFPFQSASDKSKEKRPYFLWTTNAAPHKNHKNAFEALSIYYEEYHGRFECHVTGVNTDKFTTLDLHHLIPLHKGLKKNIKLWRNLKFLGHLPEGKYHSQLKNARLLWHAGGIDNGTFSVIEAAHYGVPALSSDYPAMREIDEQFKLNLNWMDPSRPEDMALQLKKMEVEGWALRSKVPSAKILANQSVEKLSDAYWEAIKECL